MSFHRPMFLLAATLLTACSHARQLHLSGPQANREAVQAEVSERAVRVVTHSGAEHRMHAVRIGRDSISGFSEETSDRLSLAVADVQTLTFKSGWQGLKDGLKVGTLVGVGGLLAIAADECTGECDEVGVVLIGAGVGAFYGAIIGPLVKSRIRYTVVRE